jgi:integrase
MILIGYRHGLRASELCDLQWSQVEATHPQGEEWLAECPSDAGRRDTRAAASTA